jgi:hypothetical protein
VFKGNLAPNSWRPRVVIDQNAGSARVRGSLSTSLQISFEQPQNSGVRRSLCQPIDPRAGSLMREARLLDAGGRTKGFADSTVQDEIGDRIERGGLAVDDDEGGAIALGQFGKARGGIDDER